MRPILLAFICFLALPCRGPACSLCDPFLLRKQTLREDVSLAKFVVFGAMHDPKIDDNMKGSTEFRIEKTVKSDDFLKNRNGLTIPRYIPIDAKSPPKYLLFCDVFNGKLDIYRGVPLKSDAAVAYVKGALELGDKDRNKLLAYYFKHLDSDVSEIAADAFLEFAKAPDREIAAAAKLLDAEKLRGLLKDPKTPPERLSVFAYLLGACGTKKDAELLRTAIDKNDARTQASLAGLLSGYIELDAKEGWKKANAILADAKQPYGNRLAALNNLRFYQAAKGNEAKPEILRGLQAIVTDGDLADIAVEDLRRWRWWDLTDLVLDQWGKPSHAAPIVGRALVRYALCCPGDKAKAFIRARRADQPELVKEVEEGLDFEKPLDKK